LTIGLPAIITRYEQAAGLHSVERVVVDREGMEALVSRHIGKRRAHGGNGVANGSVHGFGVVPRGGGVCPLAR
jgi:hypothetical protein